MLVCAPLLCRRIRGQSDRQHGLRRHQHHYVVQRPLADSRIVLEPAARRREVSQAGGHAGAETARRVSQQSACVRALCCSLGSPHRGCFQPRTLAEAGIHLQRDIPDALGKGI